MSFRTKVIQVLIDINERMVFYPSLRKFYTAALKDKGLSIVDVGSNKGQSIDFFLKINNQATIFGFEPNQKLYTGLKKKYEQQANVHLFNLGVSSNNGKLLFHENILDETSTFEQINFDSEYLKKKAKVLGVNKNELVVGSYEVEVTTLQSFLESHPGKYFDVLKIDVEGHELQTLKGLFTGIRENYPIRFIQIESHNDDMYIGASAGEIGDLLQKNGFFEVAKFKHGFGDFYEIIYEYKIKA